MKKDLKRKLLEGIKLNPKKVSTKGFKKVKNKVKKFKAKAKTAFKKAGKWVAKSFSKAFPKLSKKILKEVGKLSAKGKYIETKISFVLY